MNSNDSHHCNAGTHPGAPAGITALTLGPVLLYGCALPDAPTRREAERAAVERLLAAALPGGYHLTHNADGAPVLEGGPHISISHSRTHAVVALCAEAPVGVDIETPRAQLARVAPRVLSAQEVEAYGATTEGLLQAWTLKEAIYKAALTPGLDFRRDIRLPLGPKKNEAAIATAAGACMQFSVLACCPWADGALALVRKS
ncbi:MAG: 4'-phosphopantetheinyl transferase superfamily protein [Muribaculaceae bacterium]|nr:4'-phosphopantetheinyl transferase superfamily protein [Muribaculaceae bacterium]